MLTPHANVLATIQKAPLEKYFLIIENWIKPITNPYSDAIRACGSGLFSQKANSPLLIPIFHSNIPTINSVKIIPVGTK